MSCKDCNTNCYERGTDHEMCMAWTKRTSPNTDCYWYDEEQDMNAHIPFCKLKKGFTPISYEDCSDCENYHSKYKKTNADRIRAMSDEELANWFAIISSSKPQSSPEWLEWLRREVDI